MSLDFLSDQGLTRQWLSLSFQDHDQDDTVHLLRTEYSHTEHRLSTIVNSDWYLQIVDSFPSTRATHLLSPLGLFFLDVDRKWSTNPGRLLEWAAEQTTSSSSTTALRSTPYSVQKDFSEPGVWVNGIHRGQITEYESVDVCMSALLRTEYLRNITYCRAYPTSIRLTTARDLRSLPPVPPVP